MTRRVRLLPALAAIALSSVAGRAHAAPPGPDVLPVSVLAVKSDEALDQAEAFTAALRDAVTRSTGWSLGEANQAVEFLALKMKCGQTIDAACETRIADVTKTDRFLWAAIDFDKSKKDVSGTLSFFVRGKGTNKVDVEFAASITDPKKLAALADSLFNKVTGGAPQGGVTVTTGGVAGQLFVDGKPMGALPASGGTYQLPVGSHTITVKAPGHLDATTTVQVQPLASVDTVLSMTEDGGGPDVDGRMVGGIVAMGLGVGSAAFGAWAAVDVNKLRNDPGYQGFRDQYSTNDDVCEAARSGQPPRLTNPAATTAGQIVKICDRAQRDEMFQAIAFPVAAVAAGIGGYLLGTSRLAKGSDEAASKPSAWLIIPELGPGRQSVTVRYSF
ncbi:MAG: PEGA domain-containing protein [Deltaproteobacteria bacterium]|nr:PEGA domain-containing protein [Deltaproteobacteria bacterium]